MGEFINICASHCLGVRVASAAAAERSWGRVALLGIL